MTTGAGIGHQAEARNTNFVFTIGHDRELSFSVQQANITAASMSPVTWGTGSKAIFLPDNVIQNDPLQAQFLVSEDLSEWIELYKWMLLAKNMDVTILQHVKPCSLILLDSQNLPIVTFEYLDAFPTQVSGIQYTLNEEGNPVVTCTGEFHFNKFNIVLRDGTKIDEQYSG